MTDLNGGWLSVTLQRSPLCTCGASPGRDHAFACAITQSLLARGQTVTVSDRTVDEMALQQMAMPGAISVMPTERSSGYPSIGTSPGLFDVLGMMRTTVGATCNCEACRIARHASDCAVHNEPAMPAGPCDCGIADDGAPTGDPERAAAFWTITTSVRDLSQSSRRLFWSELAALVEREWDCPTGYDRTAWAMEHATAGMVETAYQRVVG